MQIIVKCYVQANSNLCGKINLSVDGRIAKDASKGNWLAKDQTKSNQLDLIKSELVWLIG
jgi:hypothetical protein